MFRIDLEEIGKSFSIGQSDLKPLAKFDFLRVMNYDTRHYLKHFP
jgi:hypothetical protein